MSGEEAVVWRERWGSAAAASMGSAKWEDGDDGVAAQFYVRGASVSRWVRQRAHLKARRGQLACLACACAFRGAARGGACPGRPVARPRRRP
jgi:hypothetical protein